MDGAEAATVGDRPVPQDVGREGPVRRLPQQPLGDELDAGEDIRRDPRPATPAQAPEAVHVEVAEPAVVAGAGLGHEEEQRVHRRILPMRGEQPQSVARAVDPEIVAVDGEEGIAGDHRRGADQAAAGLQQQIAFVRDGDVEVAGPGLEVGLERVGQIMDVDHRLGDAGGAQAVEDMVDQGFAIDLDQRLGPGRGQRPHALAEAGRHDHRRVGHRRRDFRAQAQRAAGGHQAASSQGARRAFCGTLASNQSRTGASIICSKSRSSRPHMRGWKRR